MGAMAAMTDRSIFYHIPKTGGTWVRVAMTNAGIQLKEAPVVKKRHPLAPMLFRTHAEPDYVSPRCKVGRFSFCFVRRPEDWYRSYWCDKIKSRKLSGRSAIDKLLTDDFNAWVNLVLDAYPNGFVSELYGYYVGKVDFVGRTETLMRDLIRALTLAGEGFDLEKLMATPPVNVAASDSRYGDLAKLTDATRWRIVAVEKIHA